MLLSETHQNRDPFFVCIKALSFPLLPPQDTSFASAHHTTPLFLFSPIPRRHKKGMGTVFFVVSIMTRYVLCFVFCFGS